ncbi:uncharacterized protein LOC106642016 [Copidosoma floridanum]|uniref:uncharacterized protein LOC106642016 n=1 Tax=Copidosoma floridanum TaxID=29053 RepID=UPI0006C9D15B|nr:uncharacterized protein LOC106642016 [Copidosoma floridanum]
MAGNSRRVFKSLKDQMHKSSLLHDATTAIGNATERAQERMTHLQNVVANMYENAFQQVKSSAIAKDLNNSTLQHPPLPKYLVNYWQWYQQLTGMDKVEIAKEQVITFQERLFKCQDQRRLLTHQANSISEKLKEIYSELIQTKRDDSKYVQLTILENKCLQGEIRIRDQLQLLENEERDHFTQLTTAIKEYHDSQAMNAQKYKYLSILASAFLAIVSLTGSMFYNNKRIADVRNVISRSQVSIERNLDEKFSEIINRINIQENTIKVALDVKKVETVDTLQENVWDKNESVGDHLPQEIDKVKQTVYYFGIAVCALYFLQVLRS